MIVIRTCSTVLSLTLAVVVLKSCFAWPTEQQHSHQHRRRHAETLPHPVGLPAESAEIETSHISKLRKNLLESIKRNFMDNLEIVKGPGVKKYNTSLAEKRDHIRAFKKRLEEKDRFHQLYDAVDEGIVEEFHYQHKDSSSIPAENDISWGSGHLPRVFFSIDIAHPLDPKRETAVRSAKLNLYKIHSRSSSIRDSSLIDRSMTTIVKVFQLLKPKRNSTKLARKLLHSRLVSFLNPGWEIFDVASAVRHWIDHPEENYGLEISSDIETRPNQIRFATTNVNSGSQVATNVRNGNWAPSLDVRTENRHILGRVKRARPEERFDCKVGQGEKRCCRYPLWVSFSDIGWDEWVFAPEGYQAYFCDGACPDRYKTASNFSGIKSILHMLNPKAVPGPCCSATKSDSLDILHYDENGQITVTEYSGMVVQECKCS